MPVKEIREFMMLATETQRTRRQWGSEIRGGEPGSKDHPLYSILEQTAVEVEEKSNPTTGQAQIGEQLGLEDRIGSFNTLHLHDQTLLDEEIEPQFSEGGSLVANGQRDLTSYQQSGVQDFALQRRLVDRFQKARPKFAVNLDGASQNSFRNPIHPL